MKLKKNSEMIGGTDHKASNIQGNEVTTKTETIQEEKKDPHILGEEITAKTETTQGKKEALHIQEKEVTAKTPSHSPHPFANYIKQNPREVINNKY